MAIAASGMAAASASLVASASNIANIETTGPVPPTSPSQTVSQTAGSVYQPISATSATLPGGGANSVLSNTLPSYVLAYDPAAPFANMQGMLAAPNVDPVSEVVHQTSASATFEANLNSFKAADSNFKSLLDMLA